MASKSIRGIVAVLCLVALAVLSNPRKSRHDRAIQRDMKKSHPVASFFGAGSLASAMAEYHSIGVAFYTTLDDEIATVGAFGVVIRR